MIPFDAGRWIATQVHTPVWDGSDKFRAFGWHAHSHRHGLVYYSPMLSATAYKLPKPNLLVDRQCTDVIEAAFK